MTADSARRSRSNPAQPRHLPSLTHRLLPALVLFFLPLASAAAADAAWSHFQDGREAFEAKRYDLALGDWQKAIAERSARFVIVLASIDAAMALPEAKASWDSIDALVQRLGVAEFGARQYMAVKEGAGGSLRREMETLHGMTKSSVFGNFTSAWLAVAELRGTEAIHDSLAALRNLALILQSYPEAEFGIGRVFMIEGETELAKYQFQRALEASASLEVPDERYEILAALADLYRAQRDWTSYEAELRLSLSEAPVFSKTNDFLRAAMERALDIEGFDSMLRLYPLDDSRIIGPAANLGEFLLRNGRPQAALYLALSTDAIATRALAKLRIDDPSLAYSSLVDLSGLIAADRDLAAWCDESGLWKYLYYLGEALVADSRLDSGRSLFQALVKARGSGPWGKAAALALARPLGAPAPLLP